MNYDIVIIGAGPAGLSFARALAGSGLAIAIVEQHDEAALAEPADDGREIALTHRSHRLMQDYGLWPHIAGHEIGILRDAKVMDGDDGEGLLFRHQESGQAQLGWLVSNHAIRRAAWQAVQQAGEAEIIAGVKVAGVCSDAAAGEVRLADGRVLSCQLVVAADSRFSESRRAQGIRANLHDFGRSMLVVRMRHALAHQSVAWEWFRYGQTLALLPLHDPHVSSIVLTLPRAELDALLAKTDAEFDADISVRFDGRLGAMQRVGPPVSYPLVAVYPERFYAERFVCIGDAAVGMHPVTAHGFNFGLLSVDALSRRIRTALAHGEPFWSRRVLADYDIQHRAATRPLYLATKLIAHLYTDDRAPARAVRKLAIRAGRMVKPFRQHVMQGLTQPDQGMPFAPLRKWAMRLRP